ncbi:MAG: serpin family protein [Elusimicrobia bacterium]|nr:serpin family protein [Elusimicrobiota bacterium]
MNEPLPASASTAPPSFADISSLIRSDTAFALDLYAELSAKEGNLFCSPFSISAALAMTFAGSRGRTAEQMAQALLFDLPPERIHAAFKSLTENLHAAGTGKGCYLEIANGLWGQKGTGFLPEYLGLARRYYDAALKELDFEADPAEASDAINRWVSQKTQGRIERLLEKLESSTRLVLTNAVYFKGRWSCPFDKSSTSDQKFHVRPDKAVLTPFMFRQDDLDYHEGDDFRALSIPYDGPLSMVVLLPKEPFGLANMEKSLSADKLDRALTQLKTREVKLYLPKFRVESSFLLSDQLKSLGMAESFDRQAADFSGMNGKKAPDAAALFISECVHKSFIDVNEEETEAAAATAVEMLSLGACLEPLEPEPIEFRADHPFLFLIRDNRTRAILFLGRVAQLGEG